MQENKTEQKKRSSKLLTAVLAVILIAAVGAFVYWRSGINIENPAVRKYNATGVLDTSGPFRNDLPEGYPVFLVREASIEVSTEPDFKSSFSVKGKAGLNHIYNLIPGKTYYYRAVYGGKPSVTHRFSAKGQIRMLSVSGIYNVRDIGGWKTEDGKTVKYGMIFRGSEMDGVHHIRISAKGIEKMKELGIRSELDLRNSDEVKAATYPIRAFADYGRYEIAPYMGVKDQKELYRDAFTRVIESIMNDKPVYVHCWAGADRTGTIIALTLGSAGVSKEDVIKEYQLTTFSQVGPRIIGEGKEGRNFEKLINYIDTFDGATFGDKCRNLLMDLGISEKDLNAFREKMVEG